MTEETTHSHQEPVVTHHVQHTDQLSATSSAAIEIHYTVTDQLFPSEQLSPGEQLFPEKSVSYDQADLALPETRLHIARLSPGFTMLERFLEDTTHRDALTWREFEELVADLLEKDGYTVTLGRGTKDGGKDSMATKHLENVGPFMSVWQVKKLKPGNKVELAVIRELADTRIQHKTSKGMIVTTTYLTRGALERVQQDQYLLGKVDRGDVMQWIRRVKRRAERELEDHMKLVKHGDTIVAVIEHSWEKAYLTACRGEQEWVPLFTLGNTSAVAEIDPVTLQVRMRVGYIAANVQEVMLHDR